MKLPENTSINKHPIEYVEDKQSPYDLIYAFSLVKLETLKAHIETFLKTGFTQLSKFFAGALILFNKKPDNSFSLCINY